MQMLARVAQMPRIKSTTEPITLEMASEPNTFRTTRKPFKLEAINTHQFEDGGSTSLMVVLGGTPHRREAF
jgi:hypothetical protein